MAQFQFNITINGDGDNAGEAWADACTALALDPGTVPEPPEFAKVDDDGKKLPVFDTAKEFRCPFCGAKDEPDVVRGKHYADHEYESWIMECAKCGEVWSDCYAVLYTGQANCGSHSDSAEFDLPPDRSEWEHRQTIIEVEGGMVRVKQHPVGYGYPPIKVIDYDVDTYDDDVLTTDEAGRRCHISELEQG